MRLGNSAFRVKVVYIDDDFTIVTLAFFTRWLSHHGWLDMPQSYRRNIHHSKVHQLSGDDSPEAASLLTFS